MNTNSAIEKLPLPRTLPTEDVVLVPPKTGFGYRGFRSTSITAVIAKHEIIRPTAALNRINHPNDWNFSTKVPTGKDNVIKPLPGTKKNLDDFKPKPFRARPVPRQHKEPFRPELPSQKGRQRAKKEESHPGLVSRIFHSIVDPILHPNKPNDDEQLVNAEVITESLLPVSETAEPTANTTQKADTHPGLASRMWHSVVDPIFHGPNKPEVNVVDGQPEREPEQSDGVEDSTGVNAHSQSYPKPDAVTQISNGPDAVTKSKSNTVDIQQENRKSVNLQDESDIVDGVSSSDYLKSYLEMMQLVKPCRKPNVIGVTKKQREKEAGKLPSVNTPGYGSKAERVRKAQEKKKLKMEKPNAVETPV